MKKTMLILFLCIFELHAMHDNEAVKKELKEMFEQDQDLRKKFLRESHDPLNSSVALYQEIGIDELNKNHCEKLKKIILLHGWPKLSEFDSETAQYAWIIVQHADHDVVFQNYCLDLMQQLPESEIEKKWIAYLYDRIQINGKKLQRYGTQINNENWQPYDLEQPELVDQFRKSMNLEPLEEYLNFCKRAHDQWTS